MSTRETKRHRISILIALPLLIVCAWLLAYLHGTMHGMYFPHRQTLLDLPPATHLALMDTIQVATLAIVGRTVVAVVMAMREYELGSRKH